jgi:hypothetical protein
MTLFKFLEPVFAPVLAVGLMASAPAQTPAPVKPTPARAAIAECTLVSRPTITASYRPEQRTKMLIRRDRNPQKVTFGGFDFQALYNDEPETGRSLQLIVTPIVKPGVNNLPIASQVYSLKSGQVPRNQFLSGHGFTGLNTIYNPKDFSELQYSCVSIP